MMDFGYQFGYRVWCFVYVEFKLVFELSKFADIFKIVNDELKENKQVKFRDQVYCVKVVY